MVRFPIGTQPSVIATKTRRREDNFVRIVCSWLRVFLAILIAATWLSSVACQSPTSASSSLKVDDFVDASVSPNPASASASSGKTYRVVRGNNQPDDILEYDWVTSFAITVSLNSNATSKDVNLSFPVSITAASGKVEQASGGIVTPPTGGEAEHYESIIQASSGSQIAAVGGGVTMNFLVYYDLPSLRKEALITETISFKDNNGTTFAKTVQVKVAP